ncbi:MULTISPECIES: hypothetical protein [Pseudomonas syringae group]|uniref:Uncharacterized protein n=1 Tax=Pseudomonas syringae pv. persicae TaxID=237306 RepID=A0A3M3ZSP4_9PSED|nr:MULTISPECIES: hypothetical protein [Pseudomonas syringae group]QOQ33536.1 Prevent host death protein, Phd antitoxin D [Pseudomonas syringae pv. actinidiae]RMO97706.1 hypothetical protein ALQ30_200132 [Pseudomonas syringae pv. persicae]
MESVTLEQLRMTFKVGGISAAQIVAQGRKFFVAADTKTGERLVLVLHADRQPRLYGKPATALKALHDIGFRTVTVEMVNWSPAPQGEITERQQS